MVPTRFEKIPLWLLCVLRMTSILTILQEHFSQMVNSCCCCCCCIILDSSLDQQIKRTDTPSRLFYATPTESEKVKMKILLITRRDRDSFFFFLLLGGPRSLLFSLYGVRDQLLRFYGSTRILWLGEVTWKELVLFGGWKHFTISKDPNTGVEGFHSNTTFHSFIYQ